MDKEKIFADISNEIEKLKLEYEQPNELCNLLNDFFENNITTTILGVSDINLIELIHVYLATYLENENIEELRYFAESFGSTYLVKDIGMLASLKKCLKIIASSQVKIIDLYREIFEIKNEKIMNIKIQEFSHLISEGLDYDEDKIQKIIFLPIKKLQEEGVDIDKFLNYNEENPQIFLNLIGIIMIILGISKEVNDFFEHDEIDDMTDFVNILSNKKISNLSKETYVTLNDLKSKYLDLQKQENKRKKQILKKIKAYEDLRKKLVIALGEDEITNYDILLKNIPNENIKKDVLKLIYEHNLKNYEKIYNRYDEIKKNSILNYKLLLKKYNIPEEDYYVELVIRNSYEDLEKMLSYIKNAQIENKDTIIYIIETSNIKLVEEIYSLIVNGVLTSEFVNNHKSIFNNQSDEYKNLNDNINLIKREHINPLSFQSSQQTLLIEPTIIKNNIQILKDYKLLDKINNQTSMYFLGYDDLAKKIDIILELGYESLLEKDINLLTYDYELWKRVKLLKILNYPIDQKEELLMILTTKNFIASKDEINKYIYNYNFESILKNNDNKNEIDIEEELKKIKTNSLRIYQIGDMKISINRFKRNFEDVENKNMSNKEKLLYSIIKDSTLSKEEIESINNSFSDKLTR